MQKTTRALNSKELKLILDYVQPKYKNLLLFEVNTGLRISDTVKLKWSDIKGNKLEIIEKKTGKAQITKINKKLVAYLRKNKTTKGKYIFISGILVERECKNFIRATQLAIQEACVANNIDPTFISTHSFRKTFATNAYRKTKDILIVKELLNHSDIKTTQKYINIIKDEVDEIRSNTQLGF